MHLLRLLVCQCQIDPTPTQKPSVTARTWRKWLRTLLHRRPVEPRVSGLDLQGVEGGSPRIQNVSKAMPSSKIRNYNTLSRSINDDTVIEILEEEADLEVETGTENIITRPEIEIQTDIITAEDVPGPYLGHAEMSIVGEAPAQITANAREETEVDHLEDVMVIIEIDEKLDIPNGFRARQFRKLRLSLEIPIHTLETGT